MKTEAERCAFQLQKFDMALAALTEALDTDSGDKKSRDSILLSFVFTFEMAWKALQASLRLRGAEAPDYAAGTLRAAFSAGLVQAPDLWMDLREARNEVSHAYDVDKAVAIAALVRTRGLDGFKSLRERLHEPLV